MGYSTVFIPSRVYSRKKGINYQEKEKFKNRFLTFLFPQILILIFLFFFIILSNMVKLHYRFIFVFDQSSR